jgi:hypothetical protein
MAGARYRVPGNLWRLCCTSHRDRDRDALCGSLRRHKRLDAVRTASTREDAAAIVAARWCTPEYLRALSALTRLGVGTGDGNRHRVSYAPTAHRASRWTHHCPNIATPRSVRRWHRPRHPRFDARWNALRVRILETRRKYRSIPLIERPPRNAAVVARAEPAKAHAIRLGSSSFENT